MIFRRRDIAFSNFRPILADLDPVVAFLVHKTFPDIDEAKKKLQAATSDSDTGEKPDE